MNQHLHSAIKKMGMSKERTEFEISIQFLLLAEPESLEVEVNGSFGLTQDEVDAFNEAVESVRTKYEL